MSMLIVTLQKDLAEAESKRIMRELREMEGVLKASFNKSVRFYDNGSEMKAIWVEFRTKKEEEKAEKAAIKDKAKKIAGVRDAWVTY